MYDKRYTEIVISREPNSIYILQHHQEVEKIKSCPYSRDCANDLIILAVSVGLRVYMYNPIT